MAVTFKQKRRELLNGKGGEFEQLETAGISNYELKNGGKVPKFPKMAGNLQI